MKFQKFNTFKTGMVNEELDRATTIFQIATPAPQGMLVKELEKLFSNKAIVTEVGDEDGYESVIMFDLSGRDLKLIRDNIGDVLVWKYPIGKKKDVITGPNESVNEGKNLSKKEVRDLKIKIHNARTIGKYFTKDEVEFLTSLFESTVNEANKPLYKKGQKVEYQLDFKGGVGKYADSISKSKNVDTGVIRKRSKTLSSFKYELTNGLEIYQSEIIGLSESVNEDKFTKQYLDMGFKKGETLNLIGIDWKVDKVNYKPGKSYKNPFTFKGPNLDQVDIPNPPKTNKTRVGYLLKDEKYGDTAFLYQYAGSRDQIISKLVMLDESVKFLSFNSFIHEDNGGLIGTVSAPVYGESPEEFPEINVENKDVRYKSYLKEISVLLKEIYSTALNCEYDGHKLKETLFPKYKDTKIKMQVTEDGHFRFDSFGKYPDINVNLKNMKKGKHTKESIIKEIKTNIKKLEERMPGMPSQSAIASFSSAPHLTGAGAGMMPS